MSSVHLAFGFHVNLYHSFRGDTPDDKGFGGDIRVIRNTIRILDEANRRGVPVKGTWDFENAYSLETILPRYAPDIIEDVRRRSRENGDENILMGYNNGAMAAMTRQEFEASVRLAVTNPQKSGLLDVFGSYAPLIRPQEMMFTPGNAAMYAQLGIEGVCLYNSAVPFDGFRTLLPKLPEERLFNPMTYRHGESGISVIPTLNNGDLIDYGSLTYLVKRLHRMQEKGRIQEDVLLFINMDADSEFWYGYHMPSPLNKLPNMGGLGALLREVEHLPYVVFDTPYRYLRAHPPSYTVTFEEDIADGSFDGFSSWAEKPFNRLIWTRLERARRCAEAGDKDAGFNERIRLISTTHFGLSSPVLNIDRERTALSLSQTMEEHARKGLPDSGALRLVLPESSAFFSAVLELDEGFLPPERDLLAQAEGLIRQGFLPLAFHADGSVSQGVLLGRFQTGGGSRPIMLCAIPRKEESAREPEPDAVCLETGADGSIRGLYWGTKQIGGPDFLAGFLDYGGRGFPVQFRRETAFFAHGLRGVRLRAPLDLPGQLSAGVCGLCAFHLPGEAFLFLCAQIEYPVTREDTAIFNDIAALSRLTDTRWRQAAVLQMRPQLQGELFVVKRGYCGEITQYPVADFRRACPQNANLDSFNHQAVNGLVGLRGKNGAFLLANARQIASSMAWCPMRLRRIGGDAVAFNPFGTYFGNQRKHPTYGSGVGAQAAIYSAPQYQSLAPAYNGAKETVLLAVAFSQGPDNGQCSDLIGFADGAIVTGGGPCRACASDFVRVHAPARATAEASGKKSLAGSIPLGVQLKVAMNSLRSLLR